MKNKLIGMLLMSLLLVSFSQLQAAPNNGKIFKDWRITCGQKQAPSKTSCGMFQNLAMKGKNGKSAIVASLRVGYMPGQKQPFALITLPLGVKLTRGVGITTDKNKKGWRVSYRNCNRTSCLVMVRLDPTILRSLKTGNRMIVTYDRFNAKPVPRSFSLSGFSAALANLSR